MMAAGAEGVRVTICRFCGKVARRLQCSVLAQAGCRRHRHWSGSHKGDVLVFGIREGTL